MKAKWIEELAKIIKINDEILVLASSGARSRGLIEKIESIFGVHLAKVVDNIPSLPDKEYLSNLIEEVRKIRFSRILAIGGGSVIDSAKFIKGMINFDAVFDFDEIEYFNPDPHQIFPNLIVIPTTAGSGSEATHFGTIWDQGNKKKLSISHIKLLPDIVIHDPNLLKTLNYENLLYPAIDSISHCLDSIWNKNANETSIEFAIKSLKYSIQAFEAQGDLNLNPFTLNSLQTSSFLAGKAINITKTSISHSISYPLTLNFNVPHGLAVGFSLPSIFQFVNQFTSLEKSQLVVIQNSIKVIEELNLIYKLSNYCDLDQLIELIPQMFNPHRSNNFVRVFNSKDIHGILSDSFNRQI
jgi:alcohol dehydrogenase class IV